MMKRIFSLILALVMLLSLAACGDKKESSGSKKDRVEFEQDENGMYLFRSEEGLSVEPLYGVIDPLDPAKVYANLEYTAAMFQGRYFLGDDWQLEGQQLENYLSSYEMMTISAGETCMDNYSKEPQNYPVLPYRIEAGYHTRAQILGKDTNYDWATLHFYSDNGNMHTCHGRYEVQGRTFRFYPVRKWKYDQETKHLTYQMSDYVWEYEFSFSGPYLTLSQGSNKITLTAEHFADTELFCYGGEYLEPDSATFGDMDHVYLSRNRVYMDVIDYRNHRADDEIAGLRDDGLLTLSWVDENDVRQTKQFVYFLCGPDGLILADEENVYYYTADYFDRNASSLNGSVTVEDKEKMENMSEEEVAEIVEKRENLLVDLAEAYETAGLNVTINEETGEIVMDSSVLFGVNSYEISAEGKEFLKQFIGVYTSVVFNEKYNGFVSTIMVEGHTDTSGDYDLNLELSQNRAESVRSYCLTDECGVDAAYRAALEEMMVAAGYSYTHPVYGADGQVDMAASRRVAFRFLINITG